MERSEQIRAYWFDGVDESRTIDTQHPAYRRWFRGGPEVDAHIAREYRADVEAARAGQYDGWRSTPRGALALIIVLDQFPRHIYRGEALAFASDAAAHTVAVECIRSRADEALGIAERVFMYLPLQHSERVADHELALERFRALVTLAIEKVPHMVRFCEQGVLNEHEHIEVLLRFGRYPYRNTALGRESTPGEAAYLQALAGGR
jgi:uncharacterized protein (DUF924 family)